MRFFMFSVQFHPHAASVIATAGFDRVVRIWSETDNSLDMTVVQVKIKWPIRSRDTSDIYRYTTFIDRYNL
jgi:hypothetical protein